jgi:choline dehydrogenase-like flavoprotein
MRDGAFRARRAAFRIELQNTGWSWATGAPFTDVQALVNQGLTGAALRSALAWQVNTQIELNGLIEPEPDPNNRVRPSATLRDALGVPRPELTYSIGQYSSAGAEVFRTAARAVYQRLGATEIAEVPGWQGAGHLMGTHRMGADPAGSVCDGYGRSYDHPNLFLTGSGLFPTVDAANPTLTIAAVALRTAAHLIGGGVGADAGRSAASGAEPA